MRILITLLSVLCLQTGWLFAAGSLAETRVSVIPPERITLTWTMNSLGAVCVTSQVVRGELTRVVYNPGNAGWTNVVTLKDSSGLDLLAGQGASMVTGVVKAIIPGTLVITTEGTTNLFSSVAVNEGLVLTITSGGTNANKTGSMIIYLE